MSAAPKLSRTDLMSLEQYSEARPAFRERVIAHKAARRVALGPHATLVFEDRLTIHYQIQEMLRVERIFDVSGIEEELAAYNPLIPDGGNWKATFLIEYPDADERAIQLAKMAGVEHKVWAQAGDGPRIFAIANEDLDRSNDEKTAAVHFLRFELDVAAIAALKAGAALEMGIDHDNLPYQTMIEGTARTSLVADLIAP
ncbi:MAG: DUF3501 family protein [Pseudomonadales bacterium]